MQSDLKINKWVKQLSVLFPECLIYWIQIFSNLKLNSMVVRTIQPTPTFDVFPKIVVSKLTFTQLNLGLCSLGKNEMENEWNENS